MDANIKRAAAEEKRIGMELPPGFRFHPTDEELITHYLSKKVHDVGFDPIAIGEVDLNKCEPWDLPWRAKIGEKEWYFFCVRDRKYPTGSRTNRATESGYWKATGKDKEIYRGKSLVGMKKTLVFYRGRAPKGEKTNWVIHEYRLEVRYSSSSYNLPKTTAKTDWVISRVFKKSSAGAAKRSMLGLQVMTRGIGSSSSYGDESGVNYNPLLPPSMATDYSSIKDTFGTVPPTAAAAAAHVTCFSNSRAEELQQEKGNHHHHHQLVEDYCYFNNNTRASSQSFPSSASNFPVSYNFSPSSFSSSLLSKMNMTAGSDNDNHHHHRLDYSQNCSLVQLLQSNNEYTTDHADRHTSCAEKEKEMPSNNVSQDTGLTSADANPEISSFVSDVNETGKCSFDAQQVPSNSSPPPPPPSLQLDDCLWTY